MSSDKLIIKEGFLTRTANYCDSERKIQLCSNFLYVYDLEGVEQTKESCELKDLELDSFVKANEISVINYGMYGNFHLRAQSEPEAMEWRKALNDAISKITNTSLSHFSASYDLDGNVIPQKHGITVVVDGQQGIKDDYVHVTPKACDSDISLGVSSSKNTVNEASLTEPLESESPLAVDTVDELIEKTLEAPDAKIPSESIQSDDAEGAGVRLRKKEGPDTPGLTNPNNNATQTSTGNTTAKQQQQQPDSVFFFLMAGLFFLVCAVLRKSLGF